MYIDKKDPRRGFGNSNHLESYTPQTGETATEYYYGFTYSHALEGDPQNFYVQKGIVHTDSEEKYPDRIDFPMTLSFYNSSYTASSTPPIGVICDVPYANWQDDNATLTPLSVVNFSWKPETEGSTNYCMQATFNLKHAQRIVFDGVTAFGGTQSTKIPAMTAYTCKEDMETVQDPPVDYSHYTAKATAYTQAQTAGQAQQWTPTSGTATDTKGAGKNMFVTYWE